MCDRQHCADGSHLNRNLISWLAGQIDKFSGLGDGLINFQINRVVAETHSDRFFLSPESYTVDSGRVSLIMSFEIS